MVEDDTLIPVHESEFAKDKVFGYENGDLTAWVEEKTEGRIHASECLVISLEQIRRDQTLCKKYCYKRRITYQSSSTCFRMRIWM